MTHNILVDSIVFARHGLIYEVMSRVVDTKHKIFLERPSGDIERKLFISRLRSAKEISELKTLQERDDCFTHEGSNLFTYASEKSSTPPAQVTRALLSRVWKPVTIPNERPAQSPSPPRSAASNMTSAPESESVSDAKLSVGACRIGTNSGLLRCAKGVPENHTGGVLGVNKGCPGGTETGITVGGVSRAGKWEMSGVPGGGRIRENSDARVKTGDCVGERAMMRLVPALRAATRV